MKVLLLEAAATLCVLVVFGSVFVALGWVLDCEPK